MTKSFRNSGAGASGGMMIGGILLGAVLTACGIIAWRKWNRRNGMGYQRSGFGGHSYQVNRRLLIGYESYDSYDE